MARGERARPHQLHSFCHDPRAARSRCRTLIVHGQSNPADSAMALCPVCAGDAAAIYSFFPALDIGVLAAALAHYQSQSVRGRDPVLPENGFDCLRRIPRIRGVHSSADAIHCLRR